MQMKTHIGMNKTGAQMSPIDTSRMETQARDAGEASARAASADESASDRMRARYIAEASPVGSVPIPGTVSGVVQAGVAKLAGKNPELLIDKLGERLAFERTGTRLYEALVVKCRAAPRDDGPLPDVAQLERFMYEEHSHFMLVADAISSLGADPTAQTPCADTAGVQSMGLLHVVTDPRTSVAQCMNAMLTAELADNAGWELLIALSERAGQDELVERFRVALKEEDEHLAVVKGWVEKVTLEAAS